MHRFESWLWCLMHSTSVHRLMPAEHWAILCHNDAWCAALNHIITDDGCTSLSCGCTALIHIDACTALSHIDAWYTALINHTDAWCTSLSHGCTASSHIDAWCTALSYNWCLMHSIEPYWCLMYNIEPCYWSLMHINEPWMHSIEPWCTGLSHNFDALCKLVIHYWGMSCSTDPY